MVASGGVVSVSGAGADIWNSQDQFYFVRLPVSGDVDVVARVASVERTHDWAKAGVMIRSALTGDAAHAMMIVSPGKGLAFQRRPAAGQTSVHTSGGAGTAPAWVKLERRGAVVTAFRSPDGVSWTIVGSQSLPLPPTAYVGLAVTSHNIGAVATAIFDHVAVTTPAANPQPPAVTLTAPAAGASFTAPATIQVTADAGDADDGVAQVEFFAGTTRIGTDTTSPYAATWSAVPAGTYTLTAVARDAGGLTTTSAERTITVAPPADTAPPTVALTAPANGATVEGLVTIAAQAADNVAVAEVRFFVDGTLLGTDTASPYTMAWDAAAAAAGAYVLTAEARDTSGNTATSSAVTVTVPAGLPPEWTAADVGSPALAGSGVATDGVFTVSGAGADIWDRHDEFQFVHQVRGGDVDLVARVAGFDATHAFAKAGVMIRESLAPNAAHVSMFVTPGRGFRFHVRPATDALSTSTTADGVAPAWVKLARRGTTVTASYSFDGVAWTALGSQTLALPASFYVGLAVGSVNAGELATATFDRVALTTPTPDTTPPTVAIAAPADGATVSGVVTVTANATDDTAVRDVTFRVDGTVIGVDSSSPYTATWHTASAGTGAHTLTAEAADAAENRATSPDITVNVAATNQAPVVAITAPAQSSTFTAPAAITITADASDPDDGILRVDFYAGTTLIGSDTTAPYTRTWNDVPAGSYALTAVAHDTAGASATSGVRTVVVSDPQPPGRAIFVPSSNHATAVERYVLDIFTAGADPATATPVQTQDLGKPPIVGGECAADVLGTIVSLPSGTYIATVTAVGPGGFARSQPSPPFTR